MKHSRVSQCLVLAALLAFITPVLVAQDAAQRISPPRNWGLAFTRYSQFREDFDSLPLQVVGVRGGKLSPAEKFRIEVTGVVNRSSAEFTWYLFDNTDLNHLRDSGKTSLAELTSSPNEIRKCEIFVVHIEDIPFLKNNPRGTFTLEVGVTKVTYSDGSTWEAAGTPGKFDYSKVP